MSKPVYLTPKGFERLKAELDDLIYVKRPEVIEKLRQTLNEGEDEPETEHLIAKEEQAFLEGRIRELKQLLASAIIVESHKATGVVSIGSTVIVQENGQKAESYTIVGSAEANVPERLISDESPLGKALLGHRAGEEVSVTAPAGILKYRILEVR